MNRQLLIHPTFLKTIGYAAMAGWIVAMATPILCVLEPLLWFVGFPAPSIVTGYVSDAMCMMLLALLGMLCPWCHEVLVAERGSDITRLLSLLIGMFSLFLFLDTVYSAITQLSLLTNRDVVTLGISTGLLFTVLVNIANIAAAPKWLRISLPVACGLFICCSLTIGIIPLLLPFTIMKAGAAALLIKPLDLLRQAAPRIASLPEKG